MSITTVFFDLGGVLEIVDDDDWPTHLLTDWVGRVGLTLAEARARLAEADIPDTSVAEGTEAAYRAAVGRALGLTQEQNDLIFADLWNRYCGHANTELFAFAASLRGRVRLAVLSNSGDGARREEERRYGLTRYFDPILYSHELGIEKPDPAIFLLATQRVGAAPDEIAFVDDRQGNVDAAAACGWHAIRHVDNASTIAAIEALLA